MLWFTLIFMLALKIPIVYLCYVVWWAVKDPPQPGAENEGGLGVPDTSGSGSGSWWRPPVPGRRPRRGPHGSPARRPEPARTRARSKVDS